MGKKAKAGVDKRKYTHANPWTKADEEWLTEMAENPLMSYEVMAQKLKRGAKAVAHKMFTLNLPYLYKNRIQRDIIISIKGDKNMKHRNGKRVNYGG